MAESRRFPFGDPTITQVEGMLEHAHLELLPKIIEAYKEERESVRTGGIADKDVLQSVLEDMAPELVEPFLKSFEIKPPPELKGL